MAAGSDEAYLRPRGRVPLAPFPAPNVRWRERLVRAAHTQALRLEYELAQLAAQARALGWPVAEADAPQPFPAGSFLGLRVGWIAWYENGIEQIGPDWNLGADGRLMLADGRIVPTDEVAAALVRLDACDGLPTAEERRRAYDAQLELIATHVANCLGHLRTRLAEGPSLVPAAPAPVTLVAVEPARPRPWGRRRSR